VPVVINAALVAEPRFEAIGFGRTPAAEGVLVRHNFLVINAVQERSEDLPRDLKLVVAYEVFRVAHEHIEDQTLIRVYEGGEGREEKRGARRGVEASKAGEVLFRGREDVERERERET